MANLGHYLWCSKPACAKQWGPDPGGALGVAALSFTTPIGRRPDSGTGIRNIQFLLLELRLCFLIQWVHQVNLPRTDSHRSKVTIPQRQSLACAFFYTDGSPDGQSSLTTEIQKCQLCPRPTMLLKERAMHLCSEGWRGVFQPASLPVAPRAAPWERMLSGAFLPPAFLAGQHRHLAPVMPGSVKSTSRLTRCPGNFGA